MTEAEWQASADPKAMLRFLGERASERKLRLFVCACCRAVWGHASDTGARAAVAIAQHLAEAGPTPVRTVHVRIPAGQAVIDCSASDPLGPLEVPGQDGQTKRVDPSTLPGPLRSVI